jgi:citrate lyase subunit beta / citryl-CoA lyase
MQRAGVRRLMLPKASGARDLDLLTDFEVVALCETASGVLTAADMAARPNCVALMWGGEDLIADTGGRSSRNAQGRYHPTIETARSAILLAATAHRKLAIDAVHIDISDLTGLQRESIEAADLGFGAKACIHPDHVPVIRAAFRPNASQIQWATDLLTAASQDGAFRHGDQMIDAPLLAHARNMMRRNG